MFYTHMRVHTNHPQSHMLSNATVCSHIRGPVYIITDRSYLNRPTCTIVGGQLIKLSVIEIKIIKTRSGWGKRQCKTSQ